MRPETCRYCGEAPHVPADACLTLSQKVGRIFGMVMLTLIAIAVLILLGMVVVAIFNYHR